MGAASRYVEHYDATERVTALDRLPRTEVDKMWSDTKWPDQPTTGSIGPD